MMDIRWGVLYGKTIFIRSLSRSSPCVKIEKEWESTRIKKEPLEENAALPYAGPNNQEYPLTFNYTDTTDYSSTETVSEELFLFRGDLANWQCQTVRKLK